MEFKLTIKRDSDLITKAFLKEQRSEEEYMSFYLGIVPDDSLHVNPLRNDRNPTASFYRSAGGDLIFKDWRTGMHASFVDVVMLRFNLNYPEALKVIARDFGFLGDSKNRNKPLREYKGEVVELKESSIIQCEIKSFTQSELNWWLSFGISEKTLKRYSVYSVKSVFVQGKYNSGSSPQNPIYGYYFGKQNGRELWKVYFPKRTKYRFMSNDNRLQGYNQLPVSGDVLVVTKSLKDVMTLHEMGIPAVAPHAESVILTDEQYMELSGRFKRIIFNGDWDGAGKLFMIKSRKAHKGICLSFTDKRQYAKDLSDYVKKAGFEEAKALVSLVLHDINLGRYDYQFKYSKQNGRKT